ncbi:MAG: FAD-dependent oxidoreductase, partial [Pseudomonadota bacterium]
MSNDKDLKDKAIDDKDEGLSRRRFLATAAVSTVGLAAACSPAEQSASISANVGGGSDYDVIVIGGGMAGCAAARETSKAGLRTVLLEARNRLGGRTYYAPFGDKNVELGGNYIYWLQPHVWAEVDRQLVAID